MRSAILVPCLCAAVLGTGGGRALWAAAAPEVTVRTAVDRSKVTIGDRLHYTVTITADPRAEVDPPDIGVNLGRFEIKDYNVSERKEEGKNVTEVVYELATFETGKQEIPPVTVTYALGEKRKDIRSEKLTITVESIAPSQAKDIKDIKPPTEVSPNWSGVRLVTAIAAGVLVLILGLVWYVRRRRRLAQREERVEPPPPAHVVAFEELLALRRSPWLKEGRFKEYYSGIADAVRRYVEGRYEIRAMDETTAEIVAQLQTGILHLDRVAQLRDLLERCDLIKFAKFVPAEPEVDAPETLDLAWQFVEETKPAESHDEGEDVEADHDDDTDDATDQNSDAALEPVTNHQSPTTNGDGGAAE